MIDLDDHPRPATPRRRAFTRSPRGLLRLQRSSVVADRIPWQLRALDLGLIALTLPLALIAGAVVAIAVALDSPGPILYRARRIGRGGRPFAVLKFRTMRHAAEGPPLSVAGDTRYTPLGRSLAAGRLDELPQLWNVLKGEMRLVGPRPEVQEFVEVFAREYEQILSVPPGLTGPAQLRFSREREELAGVEDRIAYYRETLLPKKVVIDLDYAARHSASRDLSLLASTLLLPLRQGADAMRAGASGRTLTVRLGAMLLLASSLLFGLAALVVLVVGEAAGPL